MALQARFTREAYDRLVAELDALKQKRNEVRQDVKETREQGDLRENFPYHAAREQQGILEARIVNLEQRLADAVIVEAGTSMDEVIQGVPVTVKVLSSGATRTYMLVSPEEMEDFDLDSDYTPASNESPVGSALLGKKQGETVEVEGPSGIVALEILKIG
jgi:transcription elongation factor GreA